MKNTKTMLSRLMLTGAFMGSFLISSAQDGYFTTYGHEIHKGELEFCLMIDHTSPAAFKREQGQRNFLSEMPELEYHPTKQLALEFMPEMFQEFGTGISKFTGFRFEARYRLFKNEVLLNPTIYFEYEDLDPETRFKMETSGWIIPPYKEEETAEPGREKVLENRVILSQDINRWNIAFNWINEIDARTGFVAFGYSMGAQYKIFADDENADGYTCPMHPDEKSDKQGKCSKCGMAMTSNVEEKKFLTAASLSFELMGALGDEKNMGIIPYRQEHYFQPSIMLHMPKGNMLGAGFALGLTDVSDDLFRLMWMKEF